MGTIAEKLTFLNTTRKMLRDSLNKFGSNILSTDTFRSYDTKLNEIYDKLPKVTQSGAGFTLLDVQNGQVDDFKMNGVDLSQSGIPTPENPQEIKVVEGSQIITFEGKNKFYLNNNYSANYDEASIEVNNNNSFILRMNKTLSNTQSPCATIEFNASYLKPNTTYTISKKNSNTGYVLDHVGSIRLYTNGSYGNFIDADEYTFTTPNVITSFKILLYLFSDNSTTGNYEITFYDIQLEEFSTATDYEPYHEPINYNIDLSLENIQLAKMPNSTYKNRIYKNNGNWYFEENVKKVIFDGREDENWTIYLNTKNYVNIWQGSPRIMCNYFKPTTNNSWISSDDSYRGMCSSLNTAGTFKCMTLTNMTMAEFKAWLSTHNVIVWYELQNPVTTQITNTTLINQLETISVHTGTNIITISNDNNIIPEIEITRLKELEKLV